jgi:uncharacterized protein (DUF1800 family)
MRRVLRLGRVAASGVRATVVGMLCGLMVVPPGAGAQMATGSRLPVERHAKPLTEQEKVLQALNRFTFGPRPGDVAAVEKVGLDRWFEVQLHPERVDDSGFEAEMGEFPAMRLTADRLKERFPSGQEIRHMNKVGGSVPGDPVEKAIYGDAEAVYQTRLKKDAVASGASGSVVDPTRPQNAGTDGAPGSFADGGRLRAVGVMNGETGSFADGGRLRVVGGRRSVDELEMPFEQVEAVLNLTVPAERFGRLVGMEPEQMLGFREEVKGRDRARLVEGMSTEQKEAVVAMMEAPERVVATEDQEMRLVRDIDSNRQLQAVMTEFWLNHFNVYLHKNEEEPYLLPEYEQDVVLPHALGRFEDLLVATAKSPAMLMYLDNWESIGPDSVAASYADGGRLRVAARASVVDPTDDDRAVMNGAPRTVAGQKLKAKLPKGINENYGRELMELHTLGVGGGYSQQDVIEVAKCFTGWTIVRPYAGNGVKARMGAVAGTPGEFVFDPRRHEPGAKTVLGHVIPDGGMNEGLEVLHILATSPATARFISRELAVRFVSDDPPVALVNRMAATYLKKDGDIAAVLETMFRAKEFWAPGVYRAKVKTPLEFLVSAVRASDAKVTNPLPLVQAMDRLGMPVWGMQTPNGYGWTAEDWVSSNGLLSRMNFALVLSGNKVNGTATDWAAVLGGPVEASAGTERELEGDLLGESASERTRAAVMAEFGNPTAQAQAAAGFVGRVVGEQPGDGLVRAAVVAQVSPTKRSEVRLDTMAGLLLGSPEFQRR